MKYLTVKELSVLAIIAVINSVLEISLGSMMHLFKIPNVGTFMIVINLSLYLLAKNIVPKRGVIIIVGFITAFIKLLYGGELFRLAPSAAILMEAAIIELFLCFLPLKMSSAVICGGITNVFVLFYPFISYILFGGRTAFSNLGGVVSSLPPFMANLGLPLVIVIYFALGTVIGSLSWQISQRLAALPFVFQPHKPC